MNFLNKLKKAYDNHVMDTKLFNILQTLYESYSASIKADGLDMADCEHVFGTLLDLIIKQKENPYVFETYHKKITEPLDYYAFGLEFIRPLVDKKRSKVFHIDNVKKITEQLKAGDNVILFANHQTEVDPQLISIALEDDYADFASEVIFVAGDRVISDPMAIPFSLGRNLLCIYSKRHIDTPPEKKIEKQNHNQRTIRRIKELLNMGEKCIYVAPSGGRDRPDEKGNVDVAHFDPDSVEVFFLLAKQAKKRTHFYPLALSTFNILPPPQTIEIELGEARVAKRGGILLSFGNEIDMDKFDCSNNYDKNIKRTARAEHIWQLVKVEYNLIKRQQIK